MCIDRFGRGRPYGEGAEPVRVRGALPNAVPGGHGALLHQREQRLPAEQLCARVHEEGGDEDQRGDQAC